MRRRGKSLIWILAAALLLSLSPMPLAASAAEEAVFVITVPETLPKAGESFTVTVDLENNPGFCAVGFTLNYDKESIRGGSIFKGKVLENSYIAANTNDDNGSASVSAISLTPFTGNGTLVAFDFYATKDINKWDFALERVEIADYDLNQLPFSINESVNVVNQTQNNNGTGKVDFGVDISGGSGGNSGSSSGTNDTISESGSSTSSENGEAVYSFGDMENHWASDFVDKAVELGLFKGYADGRFGPDDKVTRAQFITVLYRLAGSEKVEGAELPFADISGQIAEFRDAIAWGYSKGYINGMSAVSFVPEGELTREMAMTILLRYSGGESGQESMFTAFYDNDFTDSASISSWARPAVYWGIYHGLIAGMGDGSLAPQGMATRAQLAKILVNYIDKGL